MAHYNARMMKKLIAAGFAALTAVAIAGCGSSSEPGERPTSSDAAAPSTLSTPTAVGAAGLDALDRCSDESDGIMYSCDHYEFIRITEAMQGIPKGSRDIRNVMGAFQSDYVRYWAPRFCGTPASTDSTGLLCNRESLEQSLTQAREAFQNMADGNPI